MTKKISIRLSAIIFLFVFTTACSGKQNLATPTAVPTPIVSQKPTYTVKRGTLTRTLQLIGRVMPTRQQELVFSADGFVSQVYFRRGDNVKKGDILAELETGDLAIQIAQAQLSLKVAETRLNKAQGDNISALVEAELSLDRISVQARSAGAFGAVFTVSEAEALVKSAEQDLANVIYADQLAQQEADYKPECPLKSVDKKDEDKKLCLTSIDRAKAHLENAKALVLAVTNLLNAQETLGKALREAQTARTNATLSEEEKKAFEQALEKAKTGYVAAWSQYVEALAGKLYVSSSARLLATDVALAKLRVDELAQGVDPLLALDVEQAKLNLEIIQKRAATAQLIAPFDGQILTLGIIPGSQVSAFKAVLTLADPSALEIALIPSPEELSLMGVGQSVTLKLTGHPNEENVGHIRLLPLVNTTDTNSPDNQGQTAFIVLDDERAALTLGEAATITILVDKRENVLWLPPAALQTFQGRDFVFIEVGGVQRRVDVRLGLKSADRVEILEGLTEGQVVIGP